MEKTVTAFVIKRSEWLRGEGVERSYLLRGSDGKRCCVGIYARALGIPDSAIRGFSWPYSGGQIRNPCAWDTDDSEASWLNSLSADTLSVENDDKFTSDPEREIAIANIFANVGITVTFED